MKGGEVHGGVIYIYMYIVSPPGPTLLSILSHT